MNKLRRIMWGVVLVALGVLAGLHVMEIIDLRNLFEGWWTLFILVPSFVGLVADRDKIWSVIGLFAGTTLLLACQDIIPDKAVLGLIIPFVIVIFGLKLIFKDSFNKKARSAKLKLAQDGSKPLQYTSTFSGQTVNYSGDIFRAAQINALFGNLTLDLSSALVADGAVIDVCSIFGKVDIILPPGVNVNIGTTSIFGGASDKRKEKTEAGPSTAYITGSCIFGGVEIR